MAKQLFKVVAECIRRWQTADFPTGRYGNQWRYSKSSTQFAKDQVEVLGALFTRFEKLFKKIKKIKKKRTLIGYFSALFKYWKNFYCCRVYLFALLLSSSSYDGRHCGKRQMAIVHCGSVFVHMYYIFVCMHIHTQYVVCNMYGLMCI